MENDQSEIMTVLQDLEQQGFVLRFAADDGQLRCLETDERFDPASLTVVAVYRYEGAKDASDQMVVYALRGEGDTKGVIIDSYGAYADADLGACIVKLETADQKGHPTERRLLDEIQNDL